MTWCPYDVYSATNRKCNDKEAIANDKVLMPLMAAVVGETDVFQKSLSCQIMMSGWILTTGNIGINISPKCIHWNTYMEIMSTHIFHVLWIIIGLYLISIFSFSTVICNIFWSIVVTRNSVNVFFFR